MNIQFLINGNLEMSATKSEQRVIKKIPYPLCTVFAEQDFVTNFLEPIGYTKIKAEECGALLITDGESVWGDMNYQVESFLEELSKGRAVTWTKG